MTTAAQPRDDRNPDAYGVSERRLMLAVLADAFRILLRGRDGKGRIPPAFRETLEWMFCDDVLWPFAFRNICTALDLDPRRIRRRVCEIAWRATHPPRVDDHTVAVAASVL